MAINFIVPEVSSSLHPSYLFRTPVHPQSILLNIFFFFLYFFPVYLQNH